MANNEFEKDFFQTHEQRRAWKNDGEPTQETYSPVGKQPIKSEEAHQHMLKQRLYLNRPIYVGFTILDVSKTLMYDIHYNYIKKTYGQCAKLLFTDTDSLCYNISTENIYEDMMRDIHLFDTSEYDPEHPLYSTENKKVLGKMKDETHGIAIQ
jgi:hypothetical protein